MSAAAQCSHHLDALKKVPFIGVSLPSATLQGNNLRLRSLVETAMV
jgi:hypothetical protein